LAFAITDLASSIPDFAIARPLRAFTPVFNRLWTRVNALEAQSGLVAVAKSIIAPRKV
jgi:hypothetical protein